MTTPPQDPDCLPVTEAVQVPLDQDERAPAQARRATRDVLVRWRLAALVDTVALAVTELVTNAVRHGRPQVKLELRRGNGQIGVRVHDDDPTEPAAIDGRSVGGNAESGRGLSIVNSLASEVGVVQVPDDGKVVYAWFDSARSPDMKAEDSGASGG
jgi:anti-sigma regulatory factor (Ser/Thr protein kinase)